MSKNGKQQTKKKNELFDMIRTLLGDPPDLVVQSISFSQRIEQYQKGGLIYLSSLVDEERVANEMMNRFPSIREFAQAEPIPGKKAEEMVTALLEGNLLIFNDEVYWRVNLKKSEKRSIEEPGNEKAIRGPKEGFIENLSTNVTLIRQRLKLADLRIEEFVIGSKTHTKVNLFYVKERVKNDVLEEARTRLKGIKVEDLIDASYIEELISDYRWSPFSTIEYTERPDKVIASLLEGRIAIMADGSPTCLLAPTLFAHFLMSADDQYVIPYAATMTRWLRIFALMIAFTLPSIFIAITTIHHGMIPLFLGVTLAKAREGMPFPIAVEILLLETLMQIVREAGLRMPGPLGQSVTIVGTLVIGEAVVSAGIVSAPVVVIIALTTIASFAVPSYHTALAIRLLHFPMMGIATWLGLVGISWYMMLILIHLTSMRSFGIPYMAPIAPWTRKDVRDTFFRFPRWRSKGLPSYAKK